MLKKVMLCIAVGLALLISFHFGQAFVNARAEVQAEPEVQADVSAEADAEWQGDAQVDADVELEADADSSVVQEKNAGRSPAQRLPPPTQGRWAAGEIPPTLRRG